MDNLGLNKVGINEWTELHRNLSYEELFEHETDPSLEGLEQGVVTASGAVAVDTGAFTGRSPKDKYIVKDAVTEESVWWVDSACSGSDNQPIAPAAWEELKSLATTQLNGKKLYVMDCFCGTHPEDRLAVRVVTEVAWMAHFAKNMFIRPTDEELATFEPDWTVLNACKTTNPDHDDHDLRSPVFVAFNVAEQMTVIGGTWYGGEIKKGIFSMMNYFLPLKGIGAFHCSANMGEDGDTALFFGLSGTGKTTLSTDPKRRLIGDDEHGWNDNGIFNFEGGCYAKCINLSAEKEPDIFRAIRRDALLENLVVDADGNIDFASSEKTQNTRVSYPIHHIDNIVSPVSEGGHPSKIIFLTCDAYGVLPPVTRLSTKQAMYHYLSGYTAKVAGTELGVSEPTATFSACFGHPFLLLHPTVYADILGRKMQEHGSRAYLVNTGWSGGAYGVGKRMDLKTTRAIIDAILDGSIEDAATEPMPIFGLPVPTSLGGIDPAILNPRSTWEDTAAYDATLEKLAASFVRNFARFTDTGSGTDLLAGGPTFRATEQA